jgi:hypothetical protein
VGKDVLGLWGLELGLGSEFDAPETVDVPAWYRSHMEALRSLRPLPPKQRIRTSLNIKFRHDP